MFNFEGAAALCHGVAMLRYARLSNGELLARGKTVTGFANVEEDFVDEAVWEMGYLPRDKHLVPWRIEDALKQAGRTVARVCVSRREPDYRAAELLRDRNGGASDSRAGGIGG